MLFVLHFWYAQYIYWYYRIYQPEDRFSNWSYNYRRLFFPVLLLLVPFPLFKKIFTESYRTYWTYCDSNNVCFFPSTGLERDKFDNKTVTFEEHIKEEHNMWHYLFFIVLVKVKDSTEYTGPESYVAEMIKVNK